MLEHQVMYLLRRYLGNYAIGLNKEALKISVWQGPDFTRCMHYWRQRYTVHLTVKDLIINFGGVRHR